MSENRDAYNILLYITRFQGLDKQVFISYDPSAERGLEYSVLDRKTGRGVVSRDPVDIANWLLTYEPSEKPRELINDQIYKDLDKP